MPKEPGFLPPIDTPGLNKTDVALLQMLADGLTRDEAAAKLALRPRTVQVKLTIMRELYRDHRNRERLGPLKMAPNPRVGSFV